ncbi:aKG-HExxH-type peptide beta-hydroxylase [Saccharothrix syringae]|uniref:aKG-HExxH-type peptide beta-hydroxylase n=1 Tax=Saccharothrix syringae TaxID=103733 RepID=UPI00200C408A|nr:HEXXH motif-containing putative peptide modification protein [Saccharothrix syringae]
MRTTQYSVRRLRLRAFLAVASGVAARLGPFADLDRAWTLLAEAEQRAPEVVEDVLMSHSAGVWLSRALRQVLGTPTDATPLWSEVGWFNAVVAAAAVRAGLRCEVAVPVVHGAVTLPTVGTCLLPHRFPVGHATLRTTPAGVELDVAGRPVPVRWEPVPRQRGTARGRVIEVVLDDLEPYREFGAPVPPRPLDPAERDEWHKLLGEAWDLLTTRHPGPAEELSAGLAAVVPLDSRRDVFAASSAAAFGAVAMSPKRSATEFGEALVHELQHSKVNALLDLVELHDGGDAPVHYAPWRDDPRPVEALLHGVYAFVSVVEFWHAQRDVLPPSLARRGEFNLCHRARQVGSALDGMSRLTSLTDLGREFVAAVAARLAVCDAVARTPEVAAAVEAMTADHAVTWRLRHVRPDPGTVSAAVAAWLGGGEAPGDPRRGRVVPATASGESLLTALHRLRALDPSEFDRVANRRGPEFAHLRGERDAAAEGYAARLRAAPHDVTAWAGLALALDSTALRRVPELVRATHRGVAARTGAAPPAAELVAWFDRTVG